MIHPSTNPLTPGYGFGSVMPPYSPTKPHIGTDYRYNPNHTVYAPEDGHAEVVPWNGVSAEGNTIYITVDTRRHALCHLKSFAIQTGPVKQGQILGEMGATGFVQGAHLHWALRDHG